MRKLILWLIGIAAVVLVVTQTNQIITLANTVRQGSELLLLLAVVLQLVRYFLTAQTYSEAFATVGHKIKAWSLIPVTYGAVFMNTVMPSGGTAGPMLIVDDVRKRGVDTGSATSAALLSQIAYFVGFALIMIVGFVILGVTGKLGTSELVGGIGMLGLIAIFGSLMLLGRYKPQILLRLFKWIERIVNKFMHLIHRKPLGPWAENLVESFAHASKQIWKNPKGVAKVVGVAFSGHALDLATFIAVGFAFGFYDLGALTASYVVAILLTVISFVPQGMGIVEAGVALLLTSYGVQGTIATAISLVFRGIIFWLPLLVGAVLLRRTQSFSMDTKEVKEGTTVFIGRLAAILAAGFGLLSIVVAVMPTQVQLLTDVYPWLPFKGTISATTAVLAGLALFLVGRGLWKRQRVALWLAIVTLLASSAFFLFMGETWQSVAAPILFGVWLLTERRTFVQPTSKASWQQGLLALGVAVVVPLLYGTIGFWALNLNFDMTGGLGEAFTQTWQLLVDLVTKGQVTATSHSEWFLRSVYVVGITCIVASVGYLLVVLIRGDYKKLRADRRKKERTNKLEETEKFIETAGGPAQTPPSHPEKENSSPEQNR